MCRRIFIVSAFWMTVLIMASNGCNRPHARVETVSPADGSTVEVRRPLISVTFDRVMNPKTFSSSAFYTVGSKSGVMRGTITFTNGDRVAHLRPYGAYVREETVRVILTDQIESLSEKWIRDRTWEFEVSHDAADPTFLASMSPAIESTDAAPTTTIVIEFTTAVVPSTVSSDDFRVEGDRSGARSVTATVDPSSPHRVQLTINRPALPGERMTVAVHSTIDGLDELPIDAALLAFTGGNLGSGGASPSLQLDHGPDDIVLVASFTGPSDELIVVRSDGVVLSASGTPRMDAGQPVRSATFGDFDGDGDLELALLTTTGTSLLIAESTFASSADITEIALADPARELSTGHLDADGIRDLFIVPDEALDGATVIWGSAEDPLGEATHLLDLRATAPAVAADFNGDDLPDIAAPNEQGHVELAFSNGQGTFFDPIELSTGVDRVVLGNADGDQLADIFALDDTGSASILLSRSDGEFEFSSADVRGAAVAIDYDGDGDIDLLSGENDQFPQLAVAIGNGAGNFLSVISLDTVGPFTTVLVGDLNSDGKLDLITQTTNGEIDALVTN